MAVSRLHRRNGAVALVVSLAILGLPAVPAAAAATTRPAFTVAIGAVPASVARGTVLIFKGSVTPLSPGAVVTLQRKDPTRWVTVTSGKLTSRSGYALVYRATHPGHPVFRVVKAATATRSTGSSRQVTVTVTGVEVVLRAGTVSVPGGSVTSAVRDKSGQTLVRTPAGTRVPAVGGYLVSPLSNASPRGLLGKVTSLTINAGGSKALVLRDATLDAAFSTYSVVLADTDVAKSAASAAVRAGRPRAAVVGPSVDVGAAGFSCDGPKDTPIKVKADFQNTKLSATITTSPPAVSFVLRTKPIFDFGLGFHGSASCTLKDTPFQLTVPLDAVPPILLTMTPAIEVEVTGNADVDVHWEPTALIGFDGYAGLTTSFKTPAPSVSLRASGGVSVFAGLNVELSLARALALTGQLGPKIEGSVANGCFDLASELHVELGVKADILVRTLKHTFAKGDFLKTPMYHNCGGPGAPAPGSSPVPAPTAGGGTGAGGSGNGPTVTEQQGHYGVGTFSDYHTASGRGEGVAPDQSVQVSCKVQDGNIASSRPDGYWYRLEGAPWYGRYYVPANTFYNGDPVGGPYSHNTDMNVPDCFGSAAPPPDQTGTGGAVTKPSQATINETEGHHGVNTFTDYHSASGIGQKIAPGATVAVSCKVLDTNIASASPDGYWYRIASSPWLDSYYAPANTFYNGDPVDGPYNYNTDYNVPDCGGGGGGGGGGGSAAPTVAETTGGNTSTFTNPANASGPGPSIGAYSTVQIACKLPGFRVADGNTWWYRIAQSPWNSQYYASADAFYNNGSTSGSLHGTPFVDNAVPDCNPSGGGTAGPPPPPTYSETTGGSTHTWTDYNSAGGTQGPSIASGQTVQIECKVTGFRVSDGNTWWYRIAQDPWNGSYYASADAFYNNGATSGPLSGTPFVDGNVPDCGSSAPPPPPPPPVTYPETAGGVAHTWTDYNSAGGTQGPSVASGQTVQIACKVTGFRVSDGDTWWYRIAQDPWSNAYYVSADAFYNNGATSGSLSGTPFVDSNVRDC